MLPVPCSMAPISRSIGNHSPATVWTLYDYYGEAHQWPHVNCDYGSFDLAGFPKAAAYWYRSWWLADIDHTDPSRPVDSTSYECHIVESWQPHPTKPTRTIHVYTNAAGVKLAINGHTFQYMPVPFYTAATFDSVPYSPGNITAYCVDKTNQTVATHHRSSVKPGQSLSISVDAPNPDFGTGKVSIILQAY